MELLGPLLRAGFRGLLVSPRTAGKPESSVFTCTGSKGLVRLWPQTTCRSSSQLVYTMSRRKFVWLWGFRLTWKRTEVSGLGGLS